ncbi:MAG: DNA alkylation repair protein [Actinomycetaceae bacterium]|nr:DNA alkylation repair protein [Actinomycetaceae bacterium]
MAKKLKDYYDLSYAADLSQKLAQVSQDFDAQRFLELVEPTLLNLEFNDRQVLIATALQKTLPKDYAQTLKIFTQILGPELPGSLGMFTEGYWLWPIGKYVELYGAEHFAESTEFSKELTKRFTGEYCMRPLLARFPAETIALMVQWSLDENKRVRRLASECLRTRLPWAKKQLVVLAHFDNYLEVLSNLRNDPDKTIQKSVANNLNDLYKDAPEKFAYIIALWQQAPVSKECAWIIKHGSRTQRKKLEAAS